MDLLQTLLHHFLILFAMVNAIGNLPIFADYTSDMDKRQRTFTFNIAVLTGGGIVLGFALVGDIMLRQVFAVSTSAFKIAGGILVFIVAAKGVLQASIHKSIQEQRNRSVAVFPLGFPFLAGPGTILTTILLIQSNGRLITVLTVLMVYLAVLPLLFLAPFVERIIGKLGVMVISRILYIFICAKAVSFVLDGFHLDL